MISLPSMRKAAEATCDFYIENTAAGWHSLLGYRRAGTWRNSATGATASRRSLQRARAGGQLGRGHRRAGLLRLGRICKDDATGRPDSRSANTLFDEPYLSTDPTHQGLILHAVYHRPNGWDTIPGGQQSTRRRIVHVGRLSRNRIRRCIVQRVAENKPYLQFWSDPQ